MGRKIPARKHFGVRDPIKQSQERFALIKDKINNPPEKRDHQKVSHSLARFIKLKEAAKKHVPKQSIEPKRVRRATNENEDKPENYAKKSKKSLQPKKQTDARNDKEYQNLYQRPNESNRNFMRRVNRITEESVEEAKFEAKYGVEVVRDKKTGEIKLNKRPPNEIDERLKQNAIDAKRKGKTATASVVIPAEERKKLAKAMILEKKKQKESESTKASVIDEFKRDEIKFGEVVKAPPHLSVPRLAKKAETVPRPGRKSLLLHSVIDEYSDKNDGNKTTGTTTTTTTTTTKQSANGVHHKPKMLSLKSKRKDMSMAMREMIESEQNTAVKLYKELKKNQRTQNNKTNK